MLELFHAKDDSRRCKMLVNPETVLTEYGQWATSNIVLRCINDLEKLTGIDAHTILTALESLNKTVYKYSESVPGSLPGAYDPPPIVSPGYIDGYFINPLVSESHASIPVMDRSDPKTAEEMWKDLCTLDVTLRPWAYISRDEQARWKQYVKTSGQDLIDNLTEQTHPFID